MRRAARGLVPAIALAAGWIAGAHGRPGLAAAPVLAQAGPDAAPSTGEQIDGGTEAGEPGAAQGAGPAAAPAPRGTPAQRVRELERQAAEQARRIRALEEEAQAQRARVDELQRTAEQLELANEQLTQTNEQLGALREELGQATQSTEERAQRSAAELEGLEAAVDVLRQASARLALGDVPDELLLDAQGLASGPALRSIAAARQFLAAGDLFNARLYVDQAIVLASEARQSGTGVAPVPPGY